MNSSTNYDEFERAILDNEVADVLSSKSRNEKAAIKAFIVAFCIVFLMAFVILATPSSFGAPACLLLLAVLIPAVIRGFYLTYRVGILDMELDTLSSQIRALRITR